MSLLCRVYLLQKKKKAISLLTHYGIGFSLSFSLSLTHGVCSTHHIWIHALKIILCIWHIISLSLSLSHGVCSTHHEWMHALRIILYICHIISLTHHIWVYKYKPYWNNYCVLEFVVVKTSSVISKVPTQLGGRLVNFCNNKQDLALPHSVTHLSNQCDVMLSSYWL